MIKKDTKEGLNVNLFPTSRIYKDGCIKYPNGNRLVYSKEEGRNSDAFLFEYFIKDNKKIGLNSLVNATQCILIPVESDFCFTLRENYADLLCPEIQISITQLEEEIKIAGAFHEIAHANLLNKQSEDGNSKYISCSIEEIIIRESLYFNHNPPTKIAGIGRKQSGNYTKQLIKTREFLINSLGKEDYKKFSELSAWTIASHMMKELHLTEQFAKQDLERYIDESLRTYGLCINYLPIKIKKGP